MGCAEVPCSFGHKCNLCQGTQIFCSTFSLWTFLESAFLSVSFQYENFMYKQLKNNLFTTRLILFLQSECVSSYFQCSLLSQAWATAVQSPGALFSTRNAASVCMNMIWSDSLTAASSADLWPSTCCCRRAGPLLHRHSRKFYYNLQETEVQADYVLSYSSSSDLFLCTSLSAARSSVPSIRLLPPKRRLWGGTMCITPPGQGCQTATTKTHSSPMNTHFLTIWIHVSICIWKPARESVPLIPG